MTDSVAAANRRSRSAVRYGCATVVATCIAVVVCSGLVLKGCASQLTSPDVGATPIPMVGSVAVSPDGTTVIYSPTTPCQEPTLTATETTSQVTLSLTASDIGLEECARGYALRSATISVLLHTPLGNRSLIDAVSGHRVAYLAENTVLRPRQPMDGWTSGVPDDPMADVSTVMAYFGGPGSAVLVENYQKITGSGRLAIVEVADGGWHPPAGTSVHPITVRGHPGLAAAGIIVWTESGRTIAIAGTSTTATPTATADATYLPGTPVFAVDGDPLTTAQLLAIATTLIGGNK